MSAAESATLPSASPRIGLVGWVSQWAPLVLFALLIGIFGALSTRFLSLENFGAILVQSSWLIVVALGMNADSEHEANNPRRLQR